MGAHRAGTRSATSDKSSLHGRTTRWSRRFQRAVRERVLASTPCAATELPKGVGKARTIPTPEDDQHRTLTVGLPLTELISPHVAERCLSRDDVRFPSTLRPGADTLSRHTFRTPAWLPAPKRTDLSLQVDVHDPRPAHASWPLAGEADLRWPSPREWWSSGP